MRRVAGRLRLDLAQYRELVTFAQLGAELDKTTQQQLIRGERMVEILKQDQFSPLELAEQVMIIYAGTHGFLDDLPVAEVRNFEAGLYKFIDGQYPDIKQEIELKRDLSEALIQKLDKALAAFKKEFKGEK